MSSRNGDNAAQLREQGKEQEEHVSKTAKSDESRADAKKDARGADKEDATDCTQHWEDAEHMEENQAEYKKFQEENRKTAEEQENAAGDENDQQDNDQENGNTDEGGKKRGRGANASTITSNKKQKQTSNGNGTHDEDHGPTATGGDKTRLPAAGQKVQWKVDSGTVGGEAVEIVLEKKTVAGKKVEGSKEDPKVVVKSGGDGEVSVLGADELYFD